MKIVKSECKGYYIKDIEDKKVIQVEKVRYPLGCNYGNSYWDGWEVTAGRKYCKISSYGGGNTWARRGSLTESWSGENPHTTSIEFFNRLMGKIENAIKELNECDDEIDKEAIIKELYDKIVSEIEQEVGVDLLKPIPY